MSAITSFILDRAESDAPWSVALTLPAISGNEVMIVKAAFARVVEECYERALDGPDGYYTPDAGDFVDAAQAEALLSAACQ